MIEYPVSGEKCGYQAKKIIFAGLKGIIRFIVASFGWCNKKVARLIAGYALMESCYLALIKC